MSVPSLEDIALYTSIRYVRENSVLQSLTVQLVHNELTTRNFSVADDVCETKIQNIKDPILDKMMTFKCLPHRLRVRWVVAFEGIHEELETCALVMCEQLMMQQYEDLNILKFCINRIILTQAGLIDIPKTIIKILKDSQFRILFDPVYLVKNVEEKILYNLGKQVLEEMNDRGAKMPRLEGDTSRTIARTLESYSSTSSRRNIENAVNRARQRNFSYRSAGKLALLAELGELSAVTQYIDLQRKLPHDSLQEQIEQAVRFMITQDKINVEMIMFLFDNMDRRHLIEVLNKDFECIFEQFLKSWRYRSLCLRLFRDVAQTIITPVRLEYMFRDANVAWEFTKYEYYDIMPILQSIWLEAPDRLKQNELFIFIIFPEMFIVHCDVNMLTFYLNSYDLDRQKHFLAQIIICLFKNNKEHLIVECLKAAPRLELNLGNYKTIINTEFMKKHLLQQWPVDSLNFSDNFKDHLKLLESVYNGNIDTFKRELLKDKYFINKYLDEHSFDNMDEFLSWCHNEDATSVKKYTSQLLDEGLIQNRYENMLLTDDIFGADRGLKKLQLNDGEIELMENNVMNKPKVKEAMVRSILKSYFLGMAEIKSAWSFYFSEGQEQESMERLFLCEEARDAILKLLLPSLTRFEEDPCLRRPVSEFLQFILDIIEVFFQPYALHDRIDEMLHEYGHPNLRSEIIYDIDELFGVRNARQVSLARKLVDCNYRCMRVLLRSEFTIEQLRKAERNDITEFSLGLAAQVALDIPVVL